MPGAGAGAAGGSSGAAPVQLLAKEARRHSAYSAVKAAAASAGARRVWAVSDIHGERYQYHSVAPGGATGGGGTDAQDV